MYKKIHNEGTIKDSLPKLIPNLYSKKNYVVHYRNLNLYKKLGMVITKVHRILKFDQAPWLQPYIEFNTKQRTIAKNDLNHLNLKDAKSRNNKNVSQNCLNILPVSGKKVIVMYLLVALKRATATLDVYTFV